MSHPLSPAVRRNPAQQVIRFFSSFGLATALLILLLLITLLGTLEQTEHGLFDTVRKYFDSWFIWEVDVGCCLRAFNLTSPGRWVIALSSNGKGLPVLPGGILLMSVLFVNMFLGAILRIRLKPNKIGVLISHLSILFMLVAGLVSLLFKTEGNLALVEGQTSDEYQSYHDSVIEIERFKPEPAENKRVTQVIDGSEYHDLSGDKARLFTTDKLPFDLVIMDYQVNAEPRRLKPGESRIPQADGYYIQPKVSESAQETNLDAAYVKVIDKKTKAEQAGILWRAALAPYTFKIGDDVYGITLTRRHWKLPFAVRLDKAEEELHPGTEMARRFESRITKIEGKHEERKLITMNEPLRQPADHFWDGNYVLFQANFAEQQGGPARSVFTVVRNPSDYWPLWALLGAMAGLLIHMLQRLIHFLIRSRKNRVDLPPPPPPGSIPVPV